MIKAVVLGSGKGNRTGKATPKQFIKIGGMPLILHSLIKLENCKDIDEIIIVTLESYKEEVQKMVKSKGLSKVSKVIQGGKTRQQSSRIGIESCGDETSYVLIHDAARPLVSNELITRLVKEVKKYGAVTPAIDIRDTLVSTDNFGYIDEFLPREKIKLVQTPQAFEYSLIRWAHKKACKENVFDSTDDSSLITRTGNRVFLIPGEPFNFKVTYSYDLELAEKLLNKETAERN